MQWQYAHKEIPEGKNVTVAELITMLLEFPMDHELTMVGEDDDGRCRVYAPRVLWTNTTQLVLRGKIKNGGGPG